LAAHPKTFFRIVTTGLSIMPQVTIRPNYLIIIRPYYYLSVVILTQ